MKKRIFMLVACLLLVSGTSYGALVAQYNFDDGTGNDSSDNSHDGVLMGDAVIINDAVRGNVLQLSGAGKVDLGNGSWTNLGNNLTIATWIKVDSFDINYQTVIAKGNSTYRLGRGGGGDHMAFLMNRAAPLTGYKAVSAGDFPVNDSVNPENNKWHHVVATYDGSVMKIYVDGKLGNSNEQTFNLNETDASLWIGNNSDKEERYWKGLVDDVRFYNNTMSAADVETLYNTTVPEPATVALLGLGSLMFVRRKRK